MLSCLVFYSSSHNNGETFRISLKLPGIVAFRSEVDKVKSIEQLYL